MICKCNDQSPHDWGSEDCKIPTYRCDIDHCGHYFDDEKVVKTSDPYPHDQVFLCPECNNEDFTKMHGWFEEDDEVLVFNSAAVVRGTFSHNHKTKDHLCYVVFGGIENELYRDEICSPTKSGIAKAIEQTESIIQEATDTMDMLEDEIKKIEEEEKA